MKPQTLIFLLTFLLPILGYGQYSFVPKNLRAQEKFWNSTTLVVLEEGEEEYNEVLKTAMEEHWKHTPFEFIYSEELTGQISQEEYSFILPLSINMQESGSAAVSVSILGLIMGGKKGIRSYGRSDLLSIGLLDNTTARGIKEGRETTFDDYSYRLHHIILFMHETLSIVNKESSMSSGAIVGVLIKKFLNYYKTKASNIRGKTLLIDKDIFAEDINSKGFRSEYRYKYKIVSKDKIKEAIAAKEDKFCYLLTFKDPGIQFFIASCATAEIYYADRIGIGIVDYKDIGKKEIKKLMKAINN